MSNIELKRLPGHDGEPEMNNYEGTCWVSQGPPEFTHRRVLSRSFNTEAEAAADWNAWMQPLHDLKAENERLRERMTRLEAQVAFLQGAVHKNDDTVKWIRKPLPRSGDAP